VRGGHARGEETVPPRERLPAHERASVRRSTTSSLRVLHRLATVRRRRWPNSSAAYTPCLGQTRADADNPAVRLRVQLGEHRRRLVDDSWQFLDEVLTLLALTLTVRGLAMSR